MSLCTPHERSTVSGARMLSRLQEIASLATASGGCSSRPNGSGRSSAMWDGGRGMAGAKSCWELRACASTIGAKRGGSRRSSRGPIALFTASTFPRARSTSSTFLVPDWRATLRQWVRRGKGRNEGKSTQHLASIGVPTITPIALGERRQAEVPFRELSRHAGHLVRDPARRVRRAPSSGTARAGPFADPPETRRGHGRDDGPAARSGAASPRLSSRQHHGSARAPTIRPSSS